MSLDPPIARAAGPLNTGLITVLLWVAAVAALGFFLGYSGGPAIRRTLAADGAFLGAALAIVHLAVRASLRRARSTRT